LVVEKSKKRTSSEGEFKKEKVEDETYLKLIPGLFL
jgi:hypothetical protein